MLSSGQTLEPSSYVAVDTLGGGESIISSSNDFGSSVSSPVTSDAFNSAPSSTFTDYDDYESSPGGSASEEYVPVYNTIDTNSLESGYAAPVEPANSYSTSVVEDTPLNIEYEYENSEDIDSYISSYEYSDDDVYSNEEDLPSYFPSEDSYQAAPSISIEYASPRDDLSQSGLVIDLTSNTEIEDETAQYGQRLVRRESRWREDNAMLLVWLVLS